MEKEALDFLMEQGIEPKERQLKIGGQNYIINKDGEPVLVEPGGYKFGIDKEFDEKSFDYMRINYKNEKGEIYTLDQTECIIRIPDKMSWEEFRAIGTILNITSKYMNNIKFNKMSKLAKVWKYDE